MSGKTQPPPVVPGDWSMLGEPQKPIEVTCSYGVAVMRGPVLVMRIPNPDGTVDVTEFYDEGEPVTRVESGEVADAINAWFRATHMARRNLEALPGRWEEWTLLTPAHMAAFPIRQASLALAKSRLEALKARVCVAPDDQCVHGAYGNDCPTCRGFDT